MTQLIWISCPHCGTIFRVAVPAQARAISMFYSEPREESCFGGLIMSITCPKCSKKFSFKLLE